MSLSVIFQQWVICTLISNILTEKNLQNNNKGMDWFIE
jgi:hypothetical protein